MRLTKKMLEKASEGIPLALADNFCKRRNRDECDTFFKALKYLAAHGATFYEEDFKDCAIREHGDTVGLNKFIWQAQAMLKILPERVDAESLIQFRKEVAERGWLLA